MEDEDRNASGSWLVSDDDDDESPDAGEEQTKL